MTLPSTNHSCVQPMCINHVFEICYTLKKKERKKQIGVCRYSKEKQPQQKY